MTDQKPEASEPEFEDLRTSTTTAKLDEVLAKAQGEIEAAPKSRVNPHFGSYYADLAELRGAVRIALAKYGISVTQWPVHSSDCRLHVITRVAHAGEFYQARFSLPVPKADPQGYGATLTYALRQTLSAAVGVVGQEDDDAEGAMDREPERPAKRKREDRKAAAPPHPPGFPLPGPYVSADQLSLLFATAKTYGVTEKAALYPIASKALGVAITSVKQIPSARLDDVIKELTGAKAAELFTPSKGDTDWLNPPTVPEPTK